MESVIWLIFIAAMFVGLVVCGFWVIGKSQMPQWVSWLFGGVVLVVILFALVYLVRHRGTITDDAPRRMFILGGNHGAG